MSDDVFIQKLNSTFCCVVISWFHFHPFDGVIGGHKNILTSNILSCWLDRPHKIKSHFMRRQSHNKL